MCSIDIIKNYKEKARLLVENEGNCFTSCTMNNPEGCVVKYMGYLDAAGACLSIRALEAAREFEKLIIVWKNEANLLIDNNGNCKLGIECEECFVDLLYKYDIEFECTPKFALEAANFLKNFLENEVITGRKCKSIW